MVEQTVAGGFGLDRADTSRATERRGSTGGLVHCGSGVEPDGEVASCMPIAPRSSCAQEDILHAAAAPTVAMGLRLAPASVAASRQRRRFGLNADENGACFLLIVPLESHRRTRLWHSAPRR